MISTLSLGSPAVMKLRFKKKGKGGRKNENQDDEHDADDENNEKGNNKPILEIQLRHGDVVTMCDTRLQAFTEVSSLVLIWVLILLANRGIAHCSASWSATICDDLPIHQHSLLRRWRAS